MREDWYMRTQHPIDTATWRALYERYERLSGGDDAVFSAVLIAAVVSNDGKGTPALPVLGAVADRLECAQRRRAMTAKGRSR